LNAESFENACPEEAGQSADCPDQISWPSGLEVGVEVTCRDCGVEAEAETHVLIRSTDSEAFKEAWAWGSLSLTATLDLQARAWVRYKMEGEHTFFDRVCVWPICFPAEIAGVGVRVGLALGLEAAMGVDFNAEVTLSYYRKAVVAGTVRMHFLDEDCSGDNCKFKAMEVMGFDGVEINDGTSPQPPSFEINVDATAFAQIIPVLSIGMLSGGVDLRVASLTAEATIDIRPMLKAQTNFRFRGGVNTVNVLGAMPSGSDCSLFKDTLAI
jgi:hypothetical protein